MKVEDIDLADICAFELVASLGTLSAAAARLGLTVPAVAAKIRKLERKCDCKLFGRAGNRIVLTQAGEILLQGSRGLLAEGQRLVRAVHDMKPDRDEPIEHLSIAIVPDYSGYFLPTIESFSESARVQT